MYRPTRAGIVWVMLLAVTVSCRKQTAGPEGEGPAGPDAEAIIRRVAELYQDVQDLQVDFTEAFLIEMGSEENRVVVDSTAAVQRPNRLALRGKSEQQGVDVVCDGETLFMYAGMMNRYSQQAAPPSLTELLRDPAFRSLGGGGSPFLLTLLVDDPYHAIMDGVTSTTYAGQETINQVRADHLKLSQENLDWEVWVAAEGEPVVVPVSIDMSKALGQRSGRAKEVKVTWVQTYKNWRLDAGVPAEAFVFTAPPDAEKVESFGRSPAGPRRRPSPLLGKAAPEVQLELLDGGDFNLASHRGTSIVMLDFWATWCVPCVREMPVLAQVAGEYRDQGVVFCALNQGEDAKTVRGFLEEHGLDVAVGLDPEGTAGLAFGVQSIPTLVLIDKAGIVQAVHVGYRPDIREVLQGELTALIEGKDLAGASETEEE